MANKRDAKKDINFLVGEVVSDCFMFLHVHEGKQEQEIITLMNETVELRNNLIHKVNHTPTTQKSVKSYYQEIYKELTTTVDEQVKKLSKIVAS